MKNSNRAEAHLNGRSEAAGPMTVGIDLGDKTSRYCVLNAAGDVMQEGTTATTLRGFAQRFGAIPSTRIAIEVGTHSPWVARLLATFGHEVFVANPRKLKLISSSSRKDDRMDDPRLSHGRGPEDLPSAVCLR